MPIDTFSQPIAPTNAREMTPDEVYQTIRFVAAHAGSSQIEAANAITSIALARPAATLESITAQAINDLRSLRDGVPA